jgi:hypothetical protein
MYAINNLALYILLRKSWNLARNRLKMSDWIGWRTASFKQIRVRDFSGQNLGRVVRGD